jgi:uncharacterized protein YyaL (SSP411 family)
MGTYCLPMSNAAETAPGAAPYPPELSERLRAAAAARGGAPRTRHLRDGQARFVNRLALETSPYLLQHAHNPVDWRPWGDEAFEAARREDKPIFLSIGYSTCHWCHVMEEESFEDLEIAQLMNERFVCIKVDREERPDVDSVYMQAVQLLTQRGGWPMSVFLTHARQPFYAGTYFPARDGQRGAGIGFRTLLVELARIYQDERPRAEENAAQVTQAVRESLTSQRPTGLPGPHVLDGALEHYTEMFDPQEGGVRRAPKFPSSLHLRFLLREWKRTGEESALRMVALTLEKMALGGIYDQVGGGFHRYSTDARWLVPHFEKMLYDNALLATAYAEAWQATGEPLFRRVAEDVLDFIAREMTDPGGVFWSATDADSEGEEGTFFVWTPAQVAEVLGPEDSARACALLDVTEGGNFEGKNVLHLAAVPGADDLAFLSRVRPLLRSARAKRPKPATDRKVLTSWNGLMISAFARTGFAFGRADYVERAAKAARFLLDAHLRDGALLRSSLDGQARHPGVLEDYACLAAGLVDLFEATSGAAWLSAARALHASLQSRFADPAGGFFRTAAGGEELLAREKPSYDGAEPTGNSVAALTLLRLEALTGDAGYRAQAEALLRSFGALLASAPAAVGEMLLAVDFLLGEPREVVLLRPPGGDDAPLLDALRTRFLPSKVLVRCETGAAQEALAEVTPLVRDRTLLAETPTAYVCRQGTCQLPTNDAAQLAQQIT